MGIAKGERKMRILMIGDSLTDMGRRRDLPDFHPLSYGNSYPFFVEAELAEKYHCQHLLINRGMSGNRIVDLYARIKRDCWDLQPDVVSVLIGINDLMLDLREADECRGVELDRYEEMYRMFIQDTQKRLPNVKFMLLEPFCLPVEGMKTKEKWKGGFERIKEYAAVVKKLAQEYSCVFVPLQAIIERYAKEYEDNGHIVFDGVHLSSAGAKIVAKEWLRGFEKI